MAVALDLFAKQGVAATPVTAIEAAAGLSAGSGGFYRHFTGKPQLLDAVVEHELQRVKKVPSVQVSAAPEGTPRDKALAIQLRHDLDFLAELQPLIAILMWERDRAPEIAEKLQITMVDRGIELGIADLLLSSTVPPVVADPAAAATVMQSAMVGYFLNTAYFGAPPAGVDADRFTTMLATLLAGDYPGAQAS